MEFKKYTRKDLIFKDYTFSYLENREKYGDVLLKRYDKYEVLRFINWFAEKYKIPKKHKKLKFIEKVIHDHLPENYRKYEKIEKFIIKIILELEKNGNTI